MRRNVYTDYETASNVVKSLNVTPQSRVVDLGCGDGVFLAAILTHLKYVAPWLGVETLSAVVMGVDIDPQAARLAQERLTSQFGSPECGWDIKCGDALTFPLSGSVDFVVGNPPWVRNHHLDDATKESCRKQFELASGMFDLCHLFIERAIHLLKTGGILAIIVPEAIAFQPSAQTLRSFLDRTTTWAITPLPEGCFVTRASVRPALLLATRRFALAQGPRLSQYPPKRFGEIADVTTGAATGADKIFLMDKKAIKSWGIESAVLRTAIRGKDIKAGKRAHLAVRILWPYEADGERWSLSAMTRWPRAKAFLSHHGTELRRRKRLAQAIEAQPKLWYRFIDARGTRPATLGLRIAMPDIFKGPAFKVIHDPRTVIMNTCFEVRPKPGNEEAVISLLGDSRFWVRLASSSRSLQNNFRRTSVSELRELDIAGLV